ncbi:hypothetical protein D3C76_328770 [compost metagenome]
MRQLTVTECDLFQIRGSAYIDSTDTTSTNLNFFLAVFVASCSATRELSVSASCTISCIFPSNSFPTRSVTFSLGVKAFETFFFFVTFAGSTITTSGVVSCTCELIADAGTSDSPNSARRISSSVNPVFIPFLIRALCITCLILSAWPDAVVERH